MDSLCNIVDDEAPSTFAMNAGEGPLSYVQNSSYQRGSLDIAKTIIEEEIAKKLDIKDNGNSAICIADFGCSTGHNSFPAIKIIIEAIKKKQESRKTLEFFVHFNDVKSNDFNTLFNSLPLQRGYHAVGVPGDFHRRLLPSSSIHFALSSWSLHWLSQVPVAVTSRCSPAWNKGRVFYSEERKDVCDAYLEQFGKDVESFLKCRAVEMVEGGLMAIIIPGVPASWNPQTEYTLHSLCNLLGSCLVDMAKLGRLSEAKLDAFNLPYYLTCTPQKLKLILQKTQSFTLERMEIVSNPAKNTLNSVKARVAFYRAAHEQLFAQHFGSQIIDEVFDLYMKKLLASSVFLNTDNDTSIVIMAVLKRV